MDQADPATVDPLAALEAEYAAVVAQSRILSTDISSIHPSDVELACSEDAEFVAFEGFENYALLPSSPCTSDAEAFETSLNDEDVSEKDTDNPKESPSESKTEEISLEWKHNGRLLESKREAIMKSMQQVKIRPPPWAQAANLTDEELVNMVKKQLGMK
ncbi:unnamed protein product [Peronospora farinosa]|uniref:Uncharacterized protein n=1 Tax=Peronospora farinosa TaxID=134698 RepID=A0AAV0TCD0_9STRA|nr:unnamed protein product [Peronospora farinosa]CAI5719372.1 unnamed protein product [Peronospora farinosa]